MAKYTESTLTESQKPVSVEVAEDVATIESNTAVEQVSETAADAPVDVVVGNGGEAVVTETPSNESSFDTGVAEEAVVTTEQPISWKDQIKNVDKKELFEAIGVPELDEFDIEFAKFRKAGGDPYQYIQQRLMDYSKVPDEIAAKEALKAEMPFLDADKIEKVFADRYKQGEYATEEEKELGAIQMQSDAYKWKAAKTNEQKNFQIPQAVAQQLPPEVKSQVEYLQELSKQAEEVQKFVNEHEVTKALYQSKRVAVDLGDGKVFNYTLDNPKVITDVLLNNEAAAKYGKNAKGEPDMQAAIELALFKINPSKFKQDILNYGKSLGQQSFLAEGQNAAKPATKAPMAQPKGFVVKGSGTIGSR